MKFYVSACAAFLLFFVQMSFAQNNKGFALYLLPDRIKSAELADLDIKKLKPSGTPLLTTEDVFSYLKDTHEMMLGYEAGQRLKKLQVPVSGRPFVVFVDNEPIYTGAFWTSFSSVSFRGVAVDVAKLAGDFPVIRFELDYPPLAPKNIAFDPRPDERIFRALKSYARLREEVWLEGKCKALRPTGKRRQSYVFTFTVDTVVKSTYKHAEVTFESFDDGEKRLHTTLGAEWSDGNRPEENWKFDAKKKFLLKFERTVSDKDEPLYLKDFEVR